MHLVEYGCFDFKLDVQCFFFSFFVATCQRRRSDRSATNKNG